ncbi:MAG: FAD-dependent oxidoreductase [Myxococcaceae bacterium]
MATKVLILGGGLSALSAGVHLLRDGGGAKFDVTVVCMEHRLGGKASSWRHPDGRMMEIGFHAIFGYYHEIRAMLERAGHSTTDPRYFTSNGGRHLMYEASARAVNRLHIPEGPFDFEAILHNGFLDYQGMTLGEKMLFARWAARIIPAMVSGYLPPSLDEDSFTAWAISTGLDRSLTRKSWFRYVLDLCFNYPVEGSAYVGALGFSRLIGYSNAEVLYLNGGLSEIIVAPIARLFRSLGGKVEFCTKATRVELDAVTKRVNKVVTRPMATPVPIAGVDDHVDVTPLGGSYPLEDDPYPAFGDPPAAAGPQTVRTHGSDFDEVVWTLPIESTKRLLRTVANFDEEVMAHPQLSRIWKLRTVTSLSMRMWLPQKVMPADFDTVVMATPQPAATLIDYANRLDELRGGPYGSVIEFEGQEGLDADLTDDELKRSLVTQFADLPFVDRARFDVDAVLNQTGGCKNELRRNAADHLRYILLEPGHWKHRPEQDQSPYQNLLFAGDWVNGTQPTASMEAATRTGRVAANLLRTREGLAEVSE